MKKRFLGKEINIEPHKIARELVDYMLKVNKPLTIDQLITKLSESNTKKNLKTRINRCLTNTPDIVNKRTSEQSRIFSIPLHYKNVEVIQEGDKYSLKLISGNIPQVRETDYTNQDLQEYVESKKIAQSKSINNELDKYINLYKLLIQDKIKEVPYSEMYKWETIQYFQDNWKDNHDENSIVENLYNAFNKESNNLWSGSHYLPLKMLKEFAKDRPKEISEMFRNLFDESKSIDDRMLQFETNSSNLLADLRPNEDINHYQSKRAMVLYLCLKYPNRYFLYKNGMFNDFCKITKFWPAFGSARKKDYTVLDNYFEMCNALKVILEQDEELLNIHKSRLPEEITFNDDNNVLVQDFIYAVATYLNPDNFNMNETKNSDHFNIIIANITWNSKDWKTISEDMSGHAWVGGDNIPHESWNFDYENPRNKGDKLLGFVKFTNAPKVTGNNNLIIFYSQGKIIGFYGKTEVLKDWVNINDKESYNLIADKTLSVVLPNKIDNIKDKGYLEGLNRVGQVGFSYLKKTETAVNILDEAIELNPEKTDVLEKIKGWIESQPKEDSDEERLIKILKEIGFNDSEKLYDIMEHLLSELSIKIGDKRICYSLPKNKVIGLTIGQKYCTIIEIKKGKNTYRYFDTTKNDKNWLKKADTLEGMKGALNIITASAQKEISKTNKTSLTEYSSDSLEKSLFDKDYKAYIFQKAFNTDINTANMSTTDLNQIFFGPPGTGKTYHTINEAIKIVDPQFYKLNHDNRDNLKERFKLLLLNNDNEDLGQIGFTTFHQSFSYEDFIEGIKPLEPKEGDTYLKYNIQEGIFKKVCRLANDSLEAVSIGSDSLISLSQDEYDKARFYKMSLGNTQSEDDNKIYDYCVENNCITIGYGNQLDFTGKNEKEIRSFTQEKNLERYHMQAMTHFSVYLKKGYYVIISYGNHYARAIGKVTGEYEYKEESPFPNSPDYKHFKKVEWVFTDKKTPVKELYNKNFQQQPIYELEKKEVKQDFFVKEKKLDILKLPKNPKNYVLIVDEINRGNVSSIFGELITLIEKDKRANKDEELSVTLPYSKTEFKVPQNVYIIGTMNTADRSIEALDTALRRRFSFREMPPNPSLILTEGKLKENKGMIDDIDVVKILKTINDRIEKLIDKDHKIGHSYFLDIETEDELKAAFNDKVIPLLEEYFFGDFGKISLVLGKSFITKETSSGVKFAKENDYDPSIANDLLGRSVYEVTSQDTWNFKAIYEE